MTLVRRVLCCALLSGICGVTLAGESWLLLSKQSGEHSVVVTAGSALRTIAAPGRVASYGQYKHLLGFLSYQAPLARYVLTLVDESTQQVTAVQLLDMNANVHPVSWMSGAILSLVLTDRFAYFVSFTEAPSGLSRNPSGGVFDLDRVTIADGKVEQFPLPEACVNPRVFDFEGVPLVYSWEGFGVYKFDVAKRSVVTLVSSNDVSDIIDREGNAKYRRQGPEAAIFSDYVMLPGAGAFRLSSVGELQQVLNGDLTLTSLPRRTLKVADTGEQPVILPGRFNGVLVPGVVRTLKDHIDFRYINPATLHVEWEITLPRSTDIPSLYGLSNNAVIYLDRATASIDKVTGQGTTVLRKVSAEEALNGVRILAIDALSTVGN